MKMTTKRLVATHVNSHRTDQDIAERIYGGLIKLGCRDCDLLEVYKELDIRHCSSYELEKLTGKRMVTNSSGEKVLVECH